MNESAQQIRERLHIPEDAPYVVVFEQAAHMDWDWTQTFLYYCQNRTTPLLTAAMGLAGPTGPTGPSGPAYYYSICEMGFFQAFVEGPYSNPQAKELIDAASPQLRIVGGGITSPDCLLTSGEGFLRNYLLGKLWLAQNFPDLLPLKHCWIPDDFGQDPELPVAVNALGMSSIVFSRLSGQEASVGPTGQPQPKETLDTGGFDFFWQASDGSTTYAHWLQDQYGQGSAIGQGPTAPVGNISNYLATNLPQGLTGPYSGAPTNYLFVPVDNDFMKPIPDLLEYMNDWNGATGPTMGYESTHVYAVEASFDDFASLVLSESAKLKTLALPSTPYWTGYYASRPALKILHYGATTLLLSAEAVGLLAASVLDASYWNGLATAWNLFAPSTHHDYICGTACDRVYLGEQLPHLQAAYNAAAAVVNVGVNALAASVQSQPQSGETAVVIAYPAGASGPVLVELAVAPAGPQGIRFGSNVSPVQARYEGGLVFLASVPPTGYVTGYLTPQSATGPTQASITPETSSADSYVLANGLLTATVNIDASWGIGELTDADGTSLLAANAVGNDLVFYEDGGDIYQFGNEYVAPNYKKYSTFQPSTSPTLNLGSATVLEAGPIRVRLLTTVTVEGLGGNRTYTREYCLVAGEPFLRMTTTGSAPQANTTASPAYGYSVMTSFPLAQAVDSIVQGTPCHWTSVQPAQPWPRPVFQPAHRFLIPMNGSTPLAAIYHPEVPAWAFDGEGTLLGCLLRNTPGGPHGASGSDTDSHTLRYAIRGPTGLGAPTTGQPLAEALAYVTPAQALVVSSQSTGSLPESAFLAQVTSGTGVVLAVKPGDVTAGSLIVRLYQPTNGEETLVLTLGQGQPDSVTVVTALEDPIVEDSPAITILAEGFQIVMTNALATVEVVFGSNRAR